VNHDATLNEYKRDDTGRMVTPPVPDGRSGRLVDRRRWREYADGRLIVQGTQPALVPVDPRIAASNRASDAPIARDFAARQARLAAAGIVSTDQSWRRSASASEDVA
jgi:hypothetical protein